MTEELKARRLNQALIIPSLPSSICHDKENIADTPAVSRLNDNSSTNVEQPFHRKPLQRNGNDVFRSPSIYPLQVTRGRVLRSAETVDSLFCLSSRTSHEHKTLCQQIANGPLANDAASWCCAVEVACESMVLDSSSNQSNTINDLMRLHRRAKSRFSLLDSKSKKEEELVLRIWLSYAEIQGKHISPDDARATYRYMQKQDFGTKLALFYLSAAKFEASFSRSRAVKILKTGIDVGAEPITILSNALEENQTLKESRREESPRPKREPFNNSSHLLNVENRNVTQTSPERNRKRSTAGKMGEKRQKLVEDRRESEFSSNLEDSNMSTGTLNLSLESVKENRKDSISEGNLEEPYISTNQVITHEIDQLNSLQDTSVVVKDELESKHFPLIGAVSMNKARKRFPRLKPAGLTGGARRLNPDESNMIHDSDNDQTDPVMASSSAKNRSDSKDAMSKPNPRVTKLDLSYIVNWDPSRRLSFTASNPAVEKSCQIHGTATTKTIDDSDRKEGSEVVDIVSKANVVTSSTHAASTVSTHCGKTSNAIETSDLQANVESKNINFNNEMKKHGESGDVDIMNSTSQCNTDFLPLVHKCNILKVNGVPFVKLGVIGKGGSSKVYRVLSKSCNVMAIKKVKLGNLDQKTIDGYANEIALLKKLQGNPSIIQMHDSEIDYDRKAIFLIMELGEVDLNQVLQQQVLSTKKNKQNVKHHLNMNFIRLTWQQMLTAVHSIHEERIIHSDLKPANFLFVKGVLKLIDFGIAKAIQTDDTTNIYRDSQIGTLNYMSPEAILDTGSGDGGARMRIGRASDIWSLGCILYQMVFGKTPFASLHMIQKLQAIVNPSHQIEYPTYADEAAVDAIKQCLRRKPDDRPPIVGIGGLLNEHHFLNHSRR
jgi:serine/threonine-protein kinase TTK/MPS1